MCTVTFIPLKDSVIISSGRDERISRKPALKPCKHWLGDGFVIYPKDSEAGGTWIAMKSNGDAAVLLNGAFVKHTSQPPYAASRGMIFLELFQNVNPLAHFESIDLFNIEPFTMILWYDKQLYECRWDGLRKHQQLMNKARPHIWSSVTLYSEDVIIKRELYFTKWISRLHHPSIESVLDFHRFGSIGDKHNDFCMNRNNQMLTVSITAIEIKDKSGCMTYWDAKENDSFHSTAAFIHSPLCITTA